MLDKDRANAAADALLSGHLEKQAQFTAATARRRARGGKWTGLGALVGLGVSYLAIGHLSSTCIVAIGLGAGVGGFVDQRVWASRRGAGA